MALSLFSSFRRMFFGKTSEPSTRLGLGGQGEPHQTTTDTRKRFASSSSQLTGLETEFLSMLEGKDANDASVLGWWCAFHGLDREKLISKLKERGYITLADYRVSVQKATVPDLKSILTSHGLSIKGKKSDLVARVVEGIDKYECVRSFPKSYWAIASKGAEALEYAATIAKEEDDKNLLLIRNGRFEEFKRKVYPNRNEHWGTEDTFCDTIEFVMHQCFQGFELPDEVRRNAASFAARRSVSYNSRGYFGCTNEIVEYLHSCGYDILALKIPDSLREYAVANDIEAGKDVLEIYLAFVINKARQRAELDNFRRMGFNKVSVDSTACDECGRRKKLRKYSVDDAPALPVEWGCNCNYSL